MKDCGISSSKIFPKKWHPTHSTWKCCEKGSPMTFEWLQSTTTATDRPAPPPPLYQVHRSEPLCHHVFTKQHLFFVCLIVNVYNLLYSAQKVSPFYEEWWFLVVIALVGLIFILLLVFILIIRGQSKKYTKKTDSGRQHVCLQSLLLMSCVALRLKRLTGICLLKNVF